MQPFIGKYILPWFGGTPSVWSTCMLFFQTLLLGGYLYAHIVATRLRPRTQAVVHTALLVLALAVLGYQWLAWGAPVLPGDSFKPADSALPIPRLLAMLVFSVGLPYFILSSTGPLVQAWFARVRPGPSPYRLYTLSNVGSLLALLSYPFAIEPLLTLRVQAWLWAVLYALFAGSMTVIAVMLARHRSTVPEPFPVGEPARTAVEPTDDVVKGTAQTSSPKEPTWGDRMLWLGLAAVASSMLLAATNQICQEIAVIPFLWVVPLTLYLLSFIIVFAGDKAYSRPLWGSLFLASTAVTGFALFDSFHMDIGVQVLVFSSLLFTLCMVAHGEMVRLKPHPRYLTSFYLMMSAGGALGGAFVSLAAPVLFHGFWELHLSLWLGWALFLLVLWRERGSWVNQPGLAALKKAMAGLLVLLAVGLYGHTRYANEDAIHCERGFYGVLRIRQMRWDDPTYKALKLSHGAIVHGFQYVAPRRRQIPASYYGPESGIALTIENFPQYLEQTRGETQMRVGIIGLGVGTLAAFANEGDYYRFYEINPSVIALSQGDEPFFTYLRDTPATVDVVEGDARISMERELQEGQRQELDVLAVDAFSSDSIPAHLLTREALELYLEHTREDGVLALHISNRHLDLRPVVTQLAAGEGLKAAVVDSDGNDEEYWGSTWVLVTRNEAFLAIPAIRKATGPAHDTTHTDVWTDDYSNIYQILKD